MPLFPGHLQYLLVTGKAWLVNMGALIGARLGEENAPLRMFARSHNSFVVGEMETRVGRGGRVRYEIMRVVSLNGEKFVTCDHARASPARMQQKPPAPPSESRMG